MDSIEYYNKYAAKIYDDTVDRDMSGLMHDFLGFLEEGDTVLDMGCGPGRDSLLFYEFGCDVTALDAAEEMCKLAEIHTGLEVLKMRYEDMEFEDVFDGIWASEALIHTPKAELAALIQKMADALHSGGVMYTSFREGDFEGFQGERYFCDFTEHSLKKLIGRCEDLQILKIWTTEDSFVHVLASRNKRD